MNRDLLQRWYVFSAHIHIITTYLALPVCYVDISVIILPAAAAATVDASAARFVVVGFVLLCFCCDQKWILLARAHSFHSVVKVEL